ncbi:PREDICTED: probably inactive leucine-rich repeat receptor-like protein kinase At5g06940 [Tarenaya hassleriana]|uniref:probably inactive leucine-rich repeat receptor-like protein kinase At5g06940 n=1 Tax=Tarenaya hassleriana TaxID=28532 RepID=UPI00053C4E4D|nr:PREDICTED: probably inactive leucine-rich repeat receptor-like protein kinase At5g06940 [Tarenaya hassleriana]
MAARLKFQALISLAFTLFFFTAYSSSSEDDELGLLLRFKSSIKDPKSSLSSWSNTSSLHHCNWTGITCVRAPSLYVSSIKLQSLNLSGEISDSICQLPYLTHLDLSDNLFNLAIPLHLSQCLTLETLNLSSNLVWGTIPDQISQFSALKVLDLSKNHVEGKIPEDIGSLSNLQVLNLGSNLLSGTVPPVIGKLSELVVLDLSENGYLASEIPSSIGELENLEELLLHRSSFHGYIPTSFVRLQSLTVVDLSLNNITGEIPRSFGSSLKNLISFDVSQNEIYGSLPGGICNGKKLISLNLHGNLFKGPLPSSINECSSLERLQVQNNGFSGDFPVGTWSLPKIKIIRAENNRFSGRVPDSVSMASELEQVQVDNNSFTGEIPHGLGLIKNLYKFSASANGFHGELPQNFCDSPLLSIINISHNKISGKIPELRKCRKLVSLSLSDNALTGEIPQSLADLPVLTYLDLSDNNLTGSIPQGLQNLKLALFNVSFNQLSGEVPHSLVSGLPASFLQGNPGLCGAGLPNSCPSHQPNHNKIGVRTLVLALICLAFAICSVLLAVWFILSYRCLRKKAQPKKRALHSVFYYPLRLTENDILTVMNDKNPSGSEGGGPFGRVYVMGLPGGEAVAVKKLVNFGNQSPKTLKGEVRNIAKVRHKNIVRILGFCYSDESIFLIYEFIENGSLRDMLSRPSSHLPWSSRLRIAVGIAQGLSYLSKDYVPNLLHRNLKSTNILLDNGLEPKLTDFSLDRILGESAFQSISCADSCYIAPEYNYSKKATEEMEVYSFGVILLELVTGRRAERAEEGEKDEQPLDIVKWVRRKINITNGAVQVLDPKIVSESSRSEMITALDIALRCTAVVPENRPSLLQVIKSLQSIGSGIRHAEGELPVSV